MTTGFRLVALSGGLQDAPLAVGAPVEPVSGLVVTVTDSAGNAMVELRSSRDGAPMTAGADGTPILEIAHVTPGQVITTTDGAFLIAAPYGVYVRPDANAADRATRLDAILGAAWREWDRDAPSASTDAQPSAPAADPVPTGTATTLRRIDRPKRRLPLLVASAAVAALAIGATLVPEAPPPAAAGERPVVAASPEPEAAAPRVDVRDEAPAEGATPVAAAAEVAPPAPAQPVAPAKAAAPRKPIPKKPAATPTPVDPLTDAQVAAVAKQIESYQLEAGFDPEGATKKLRALRARYGASPRVTAMIDRALRGISF